MAKAATIGQARVTGEVRDAAARSPYSRQAAGTLAAATVLSMIHSVYTAIVFDADYVKDPVLYLLYGVLWGLVAFVRTDKIAAWRTAAVALALLIAIGIFYYPTVFVPAQQTTFGWFENDVYMGLLILAEYLCIQRLRGVALTPGA